VHRFFFRIKFDKCRETCAPQANYAGIANDFTHFIRREIFIIVDLMLSWTPLFFAIGFYNDAQRFQARRVLNMVIGNGDYGA
jgi:hypothetical protein